MCEKYRIERKLIVSTCSCGWSICLNVNSPETQCSQRQRVIHLRFSRFECARNEQEKCFASYFPLSNFELPSNRISKWNVTSMLRNSIRKSSLKKKTVSIHKSVWANVIWCVINTTWLWLFQFEWKIAKVIKLIIVNNLFIIIKWCKFTSRTRHIQTDQLRTSNNNDGDEKQLND